MATDNTTELEIKLAYLEAAHEELNQVVIKQQTSIDKLEKQLKHVSNLLKSMNASEISDITPEKPPHY